MIKEFDSTVAMHNQSSDNNRRIQTDENVSISILGLSFCFTEIKRSGPLPAVLEKAAKMKT